MLYPPAFDKHESETHEHVEWTTWQGERRGGIVMSDYGDMVDVATYDGRIVRKQRADVTTTRKAAKQ